MSEYPLNRFWVPPLEYVRWWVGILVVWLLVILWKMVRERAVGENVSEAPAGLKKEVFQLGEGMGRQEGLENWRPIDLEEPAPRITMIPPLSILHSAQEFAEWKTSFTEEMWKNWNRESYLKFLDQYPPPKHIAYGEDIGESAVRAASKLRVHPVMVTDQRYTPSLWSRILFALRLKRVGVWKKRNGNHVMAMRVPGIKGGKR